MNSIVCLKCFDVGHYKSTCNTTRCFICRSTDHIASSCQYKDYCNNCGEKGHKKENCKDKKKCFRCQSTEHIQKDCEHVKCIKCLKKGHNIVECTNKERCRYCGVYGHIGAMCNIGTNVCFICRDRNHFSIDCKYFVSKDQMECTVCKSGKSGRVTKCCKKSLCHSCFEILLRSNFNSCPFCRNNELKLVK